MENVSGFLRGEEPMDLPPGFRFHPTDEELITHYLSPKVLDSNFYARAIGDVDLNKCEPWDLPRMAKMGEKEWYFFCVRDRKYPTGLRTNRATEAGYWKATGKDKEIYRGKALVGMKKTLVFYKGRAPKGEKSNWVMHEYRLEGKFCLPNLPSTAKVVISFPSHFPFPCFPFHLSFPWKNLEFLHLMVCGILCFQNEWVICRVFHKSAGGKKILFPDTTRSDSLSTQFGPSSSLPPLMESSPYSDQSNPGAPGSVHVSCFSNSMINSNTSAQASHDYQIFDSFNPSPFYFQRNTAPNSLYSSQIPPIQGNFMSDQAILRAILDNNNSNDNNNRAVLKQSMKAERDMPSVSQDTCLTSDMNAEISSVVSNYEMGKELFDDQEGPSISGGPVDIDCFWNY
ncbi:hypothetical protein Ancab_038862 [Ancistrocladus abbreviatus]